MYYINKYPNEFGYFGNPMCQPFDDSVILPEDLLDSYLDANGFVKMNISDGVVVSVEENSDALSWYKSNFQTSEVEQPTTEERISALESAMLAMMGVNANV